MVLEQNVIWSFNIILILPDEIKPSLLKSALSAFASQLFIICNAFLFAVVSVALIIAVITCV